MEEKYVCEVLLSELDFLLEYIVPFRTKPVVASQSKKTLQHIFLVSMACNLSSKSDQLFIYTLQ